MTTLYDINQKILKGLNRQIFTKVDTSESINCTAEVSNVSAGGVSDVSTGEAAALDVPNKPTTPANSTIPAVTVVNKDTPATTTPAAPVLSEEEMLALVAPNLYSYHTKYDEEVEKSEKQQQIFMAFNGLFVRRTEKFNDNTIALISEVKKVPGLRSMKEGIQVDLKNKLPFDIYVELVANYRAIYMRDTTESSAQVYRLKEADEMFPGKVAGDYVVYYPKQKNSGANTNYKDDIDAVINIRQKHTLVMESHAHANFGAFFSGGDDSNEKAPLAYCVIGNVASDRVSFVGRVKLMDKEQRMELNELFEVPSDMSEPLVVANLNLPAPSLRMLENAKPATYTGVKTAAELAEERQKQGIVIPGSVTNFQHGVYGSNYNGYGRGYYGTANYGKHYSDSYPSYDKYSAKSERKKNKALMKLDVEWIADNLNDARAVELLELLTKRVEKMVDAKNGGSK